MKLKIPAIDRIVHPDHFTYGIVQMDIKKNDDSVRQLSGQFLKKIINLHSFDN